MKNNMSPNFLEEILPYYPTAYVYKKNEIIVEPKNNIYFRIDNISSLMELKCKLLEYCTRSAVKGVSEYWQRYMRRGINSYFRKNWSRCELETIYTRLGNGVNRSLCVKFIESSLDLSILARQDTDG